MKSKKTNVPRETSKDRMTVLGDLTLRDLRPSLRGQFGSSVSDMAAGERRNLLALTKIFELIVSGRIPQRAGEDYFVTVCRLIVHGLSDTQASAATRRALDKALAEIKRGNPWTTGVADLAEMRGWRGKRAVTRTVLLLSMLEKSIGRTALMGWLERPNPNLGGRSPIDLLRTHRWVMLADFLDDMLTGSTT
jgi:hypothetical protein